MTRHIGWCINPKIVSGAGVWNAGDAAKQQCICSSWSLTSASPRVRVRVAYMRLHLADRLDSLGGRPQPRRPCVGFFVAQHCGAGSGHHGLGKQLAAGGGSWQLGPCRRLWGIVAAIRSEKGGSIDVVAQWGGGGRARSGAPFCGPGRMHRNGGGSFCAPLASALAVSHVSEAGVVVKPLVRKRRAVLVLRLPAMVSLAELPVLDPRLAPMTRLHGTDFS